MYNVSVLAIYTSDHEPWGGVIDYESLSETDRDQNCLKVAIEEARVELAENPDYRCGSATIENCDVSNLNFEKMPFTGTIKEEIVLYMD